MRSRAVQTGLAALATGAFLGLAAIPAAAEEVHVLTSTISGEGTFNQPRAVAVDDSTSSSSAGDIYVADTRHNRVIKFSPSGGFLLMWGNEVNEGTGNPDICTNAGAPADICKVGSGGSGPSSFQNAWNLAVDPSSGPSAGDVYVTDISQNVQKFEPLGALITSWGGSPFPGAMNSFSFNGTYQPIAVDSAGNLEVLSGRTLYRFGEDGTSLGTVTSPTTAANGLAVDAAGDYFQINSGGSSVEEVGPTGTDLGRVSSGTTSQLGLAFDPSHDDLFVTGGSFFSGYGVSLYHFNGAGEVVEPDSSSCAPNPSGCGATETFGFGTLSTNNGGPAAVAVNTATRQVYVADTGGNDIKVYSLINVPKVSTDPATAIARDSVQFNGEVNPDGAGDVTSCEFEYGTTTEYESGKAPCAQTLPITAPMTVSVQLPPETLASETTYHYRLVAGNANGSHPAGDQTFTTPPAVGGVESGAATEVGRLAATLNGSFVGDGVDTSYRFEYGPTESYGQSTPDVDQGTATGPQDVKATVHGLYPYYTYHYRLVAQNRYGTTIGADETLKTLAPELPSVERTYSATVGPHAATVEADIDPGEGATVYRFEYGTTTDYGSRTLVGGPIEPESANRTASAEVSELAPGTTYHFRVVATNFTGTTVGADETFTTPSAPVIVSSSAAGVTQSTAVLNALIDPSLGRTTYRFEYGPSAAYGYRTAESAPVGPDNALHVASAAVSGLAPGTVYHFRVVATNEVGVATGVDGTFTTTSLAPNAPVSEGKKCKKRFVRRHGKCVRRKHRRKGHHRRHHIHHRGHGGHRHG